MKMCRCIFDTSHVCPQSALFIFRSFRANADRTIFTQAPSTHKHTRTYARARTRRHVCVSCGLVHEKRQPRILHEQKRNPPTRRGPLAKWSLKIK